ncbi:MAG: hypothetical protein ACOYMG_29655 [Candidatus Methylumidiphilus sp.]
MTARIRLIVTGVTEELALHNSLRRFFPSLRSNGEAVEWDVPRFHSGGATSNRLDYSAPPNGAMKKLARIMLNEAIIGKDEKPADLIILVDDVELGNVGQELVVAHHFRLALQQELSKVNYSRHSLMNCQQILRNNCSFHLLKPMIEAYFFGGDVNALRIAGVSSHIKPKLVNTDVEIFETNDVKYLGKCKNQQGKPWWREECHPKKYLDFLIKQDRDGRQVYEETKHVIPALLALDWTKVPIQTTEIPVVRSLFADIADWFGVPNPLPGDTNSGFYPSANVPLNTLLLRNL